jgi:hypothetical protein
MSKTSATDEIVATIVKIHGEVQDDNYVSSDDEASDASDDEDTTERVAKKAKLFDIADALTKDEAVKLSNAAMLYHIIMGIADWGHEAIDGSEDFAERVVKLGEKKLKKKYKNKFDVQAIAKALREKALASV